MMLYEVHCNECPKRVKGRGVVGVVFTVTMSYGIVRTSGWLGLVGCLEIASAALCLTRGYGPFETGSGGSSPCRLRSRTLDMSSRHTSSKIFSSGL